MFSIVAGTLNRKALLPKLLENTIYSCDLVELILVDGGSTDGSVEYLDSIEHPNLTFIKYGKRSFYPQFMNLGIKEAKNPYIVQWNDDILLDTTWDEVAKCLDEKHDLYNFPYRSETVDMNKIGTKFHRSSCMGYPFMLRDYCINFGIYSKKCLDSIGVFDERIQWHHGDAELTARAVSMGYKMKLCKNIPVVEMDVRKNINTHDTPSMTNDANILRELLIEYNIDTNLYFRYISDGRGLTLK